MDYYTKYSWLWKYLILLTSCIIAYYPILRNDFLYFWDDQWVVMNNYTSGGFSYENIFHIFTEFYHGQYAPMNELFYLLLYSIRGYDPYFFHAICLILHFINSILLFHFVQKMLSYNKSTQKKHIPIALCTSIIFCIHTVNVESVAWISASKVLIYTFFYLLSLLCYLYYIDRQKTLYYCLTFILFILSFLSKEQAVVLPVCLLLIDYFTKRDFKNSTIWKEKFPFFLFAIFFGLVTIQSQGIPINTLSYSIKERFIFACYAIFEYTVKCIFPLKLSYLYPFPIQPGEVFPFRFFMYPFILLFMIFYLYTKKEDTILIFSVLFFIIHISVAIHIIPISRFAIVADRYVYISSMGVSFLTSYILISYYYNSKSYLRKLSIILLASSYISYLGIYTNYYSRQWKDTNTLKSNIRNILKTRVTDNNHTFIIK